MCGIFFSDNCNNEILNELILNFNKIQHRGPDKSVYILKNNKFLGFHRLAINGLDNLSDQPFSYNGIYLICNGEIYNYKNISNLYNIKLDTNSDCEIIIKLYINFGIDMTMELIDGEFAFILYDSNKNLTYIARDHLGIRGLYYGKGQNGNSNVFASELKALTNCKDIIQFPPANYAVINYNNLNNHIEYINYYNYNVIPPILNDENYILKNIKRKLEDAIKIRIENSDVEVGCLLSGGLDSSLIASIASKYYKELYNKKIKTFSIGLKGSQDLKYAKMVADFIDSEHYTIICDDNEFLDAIEDTIYTIGSYDITTVRASVGHRLVAKFVANNTNVKVLFTGETADEYGSYAYFVNAENEDVYHKESLRLLNDIHFFDGLRGDRCISAAGLEARVPFADRKFLEFYLSIIPSLKMFGNNFNNRMEKYLIRKAFDDGKTLPNEVLWRKKDGFSDSVSGKTKTWYEIIEDFVNQIITDEVFIELSQNYSHNKPKTKEALFYRSVFENKYGINNSHIIPYFWMPKWSGDLTNPSGRIISNNIHNNNSIININN